MDRKQLIDHVESLLDLGCFTYSFCLFFGPGLLFDLALSSTPSPSSLFTPVFGTKGPFWFMSTVGIGGISGTLGAGDVFVSDLTSAELAFSFETAGTGVEVDEDLD